MSIKVEMYPHSQNIKITDSLIIDSYVLLNKEEALKVQRDLNILIPLMATYEGESNDKKG